VASILSIFEPVVTVVAAALVFGEQLSAVQWLGGGLVLASVVIVQWPRRQSLPELSRTSPEVTADLAV